MHKKFLLLGIEEIVLPLLPSLLVLRQCLHELRVVLELRIHHFNVLLVLPQKDSNIVKSCSNLLCEHSYSFRLLPTYSPQYPLGLAENLMLKLPAVSTVVRHLIDLVDYGAKILTGVHIVLAVY